MFRSQKNKTQEEEIMRQKAKILEICKNILLVKIYINVTVLNEKGYF